MSTNNHQQKLIPLALAADLLVSRLGKRPSRRTLRRWAVEGRDGRHLQVIRLGPGWWTRPEWVSEFIDSFVRPAAKPIGSKKARVRRAIDELRRQGLRIDQSQPGENS
jgi:hypothetical protein